MKNLVIFSLIVIVILFSCKNSSKEYLYLDPMVSISEIMVYTDDIMLDSLHFGTIKQCFESAIPGYPKYAPYFKVIKAGPSSFDKFYRNYHNIVILLTKDNIDELISGDEVKKHIQTKINQDSSIVAINLNDIWVKGQNILIIYADNHKDLMKKLNVHCETYLDIALRNESKTAAKKVIGKDFKTNTFFNEMKRKHGFGIKKPNDFRLAKSDSNFYWLRKNEKEYDMDVMVYIEDYTSKTQLNSDSLVKRRNSFTKKYIPGPSKGSYMTISPFVEPYIKTVRFSKQKNGFEMRGWWRVENNFMGGPFVSYTLVDENTQKLITLDAYIYAPDRAKTKLMRQAEITLKTFE